MCNQNVHFSETCCHGAIPGGGFFVSGTKKGFTVLPVKPLFIGGAEGDRTPGLMINNQEAKKCNGTRQNTLEFVTGNMPQENTGFNQIDITF